MAATVGRDLLTLHGHVEQMGPEEGSEEDLLRVHSREHVRAVRAVCEAAERSGAVHSIDPDTKVSSATWEAALGSVGSAIAAARAVSGGVIRNAFVATRPPGHHATPERAMGFCLFNNVAVAARWLLARGEAERVLIVDWDVHHGNGTQDAFYDDASVCFVSLHQAPHYPGTGAALETGAGVGEGFTVNVPLPAGTAPETYLRHFDATLDDVLGRFAPDFVLVSAGFDCMAGDPLGDFLLEPRHLFAMTRRLVEVAHTACDGRLVALLEGGYDPKRLGDGVVAVIRALAGLEAPES